MARKKPQTFYFKTIADMHAVPDEKLDWFCEDLRLWLRMHRMADANKMKVISERNVFGWIDDGRHNIKVHLHMKAAK